MITFLPPSHCDVLSEQTSFSRAFSRFASQRRWFSRACISKSTPWPLTSKLTRLKSIGTSRFAQGKFSLSIDETWLKPLDDWVELWCEPDELIDSGGLEPDPLLSKHMTFSLPWTFRLRSRFRRPRLRRTWNFNSCVSEPVSSWLFLTLLRRLRLFLRGLERESLLMLLELAPGEELSTFACPTFRSPLPLDVFNRPSFNVCFPFLI